MRLSFAKIAKDSRISFSSIKFTYSFQNDKILLMSKRTRGKKNRRSGTLSKLLSSFIIAIAIGYFLYKNFPPFHVFVDRQVAKARTFAEKILQNDSQDSTRIHTDERGPERISKGETGLGADASSRQEENKSKDSTQISESENQVSSKSEFISLPKNLEFPLCAGASHAADHERRNYEYYSICYRESYEQAEWSAYCLTSEHLQKNASRTDDFRPDPEISTGSATLADYKGSGYDRGHLSPAADFAFDKTAMSETFYMSNMSPQAGGLNRGIWKDLEATVRNWAAQFGRVYVVSGPILEKPAEDYESIGSDKVTVPQYYYKVLLAPLYADEKDRETPDDAKNVIAIGFIFPNEKCDGGIFDFAVSIDEVEKRTGIDFFNELSDDIENKIEAEVDVKDWKD